MATIMVVDDDRLVRWAIRTGLSRDSHDVFCARDAGEAVKQAERTTFDIVILDYEMPGMSGIELLDEMQRMAPQTKVIVLSGCVDLDRRQLLERGADAYMEKPFVIDEIRRFVGRAVDSQPTADSRLIDRHALVGMAYAATDG